MTFIILCFSISCSGVLTSTTLAFLNSFAACFSCFSICIQLWNIFYTRLVVGAVTWAKPALSGAQWRPIYPCSMPCLPQTWPFFLLELPWFCISFLTLVAAVISLPAIPFPWNRVRSRMMGKASAGSSVIRKPVHHSSVWTELGLPWP